MLCFKWIFHIYDCLPDLCGLKLCVWEIWSGSNNCVYMYPVFHWLAKKRRKKRLQKKGSSLHRFWNRPYIHVWLETRDFFGGLKYEYKIIPCALISETPSVFCSKLWEIFHIFLMIRTFCIEWKLSQVIFHFVYFILYVYFANNSNVVPSL